MLNKSLLQEIHRNAFFHFFFFISSIDLRPKETFWSYKFVSTTDKTRRVQQCRSQPASGSMDGNWFVSNSVQIFASRNQFPCHSAQTSGNEKHHKAKQWLLNRTFGVKSTIYFEFIFVSIDSTLFIAHRFNVSGSFIPDVLQ